MAGGKVVGTRMTAVRIYTPPKNRKLRRGEMDHAMVEVTHEQLHSTKGWRLVKKFISPAPADAPVFQQHFVPAEGLATLDDRLHNGPSEAGRLMRGRIPNPGPVRLTCHDWFRRQAFGASKRIANMSDAERTNANFAMEGYRAAQKGMR